MATGAKNVYGHSSQKVGHYDGRYIYIVFSFFFSFFSRASDERSYQKSRKGRAVGHYGEKIIMTYLLRRKSP